MDPLDFAASSRASSKNRTSLEMSSPSRYSRISAAFRFSMLHPSTLFKYPSILSRWVAACTAPKVAAAISISESSLAFLRSFLHFSARSESKPNPRSLIFWSRCQRSKCSPW